MKFAFSHRVINKWNNLPDKAVMAKSDNEFKNLLDENLSHIQYEFD